MNESPIEWTDKTVNPKVFETVFRERKGCPHRCPYCYVCKFPDAWLKKWESGFFPERIKGTFKNKTVFVESIGDLFHKDVPLAEIEEVLKRCAKLDKSNTICFLTKNPARYREVVDLMGDNIVLGITMETHAYPDGFNNNVKDPMTRAEDFIKVKWLGDAFISGEPLMEMNSKIYLKYIKLIKPKYMLFGLNSLKDIQILEASYESFRFLVGKCREMGIQVIIKKNMARWGVLPVLMKIKHNAPKLGGVNDFEMQKRRVIQRTLM
jgi:protein gp37